MLRYPPVLTKSGNDNIDLSAYGIALEGWRRGLKVRWHKNSSESSHFLIGKNSEILSLSYKGRTHFFYKSAGDKISNEAIISTIDKEKMNNILIDNDFSTREMVILNNDITSNNVKVKIEEINGPVILFTNNKHMKTSNILIINDKSDIDETLFKITSNKSIKSILIKQFIPQEWYRLYVIDEKIVAGAKLSYKESLQVCSERYYLINKVKINDLYKKEHVEDLDHVPKQIRDEAIKVFQIIPGLTHGSIDITTCKKQGEEKIVILDINPISDITSAIFSENNCIFAKLVDFYFPETTNKKGLNDLLYFDYKRTTLPITSGSANITTVKPNHSLPSKSVKITIKGSLPSIESMLLIKDYAHKHNIIGSVYSEKDSIIIIAAGEEKYLREFREQVQRELNSRKYTEIKITDYKGTVKNGFVIINGKTMLLKEIESLKKQYNNIEKEKMLLEEKYYSMHHSYSWKISSPLRMLSSVLKKVIRRN